MAKQLGLHKVQGRVGEYSYYESKNGGSLMRSINQGLSERVKSSKEYANTRLNNAEFGGAGSCAGAIVRGITSRWRFILSPKATGLLAKVIKAGMILDTTSAWGKRKLQNSTAEVVQERFNMLSKNPMPDFIKSFVQTSIKYDEDNTKAFTVNSLDSNVEFEQELISKGANGVKLSIYSYASDAPTPDPIENKYEPCNSNIILLNSLSSDVAIDGTGTATIIPDDSTECEVVPQIDIPTIGGILVVMLPYKTVGNVKYTLQEHCSAYWTAVESGTAPEP